MPDPVTLDGTIVWREIGNDRLPEFVARGYRRRSFFPHRVLFLPKAGPDGYKLAGRMCGLTDPARIWEIVLYADESMLGEFPDELFIDDELVWHQQHFGVPGQVATANVVLDGASLWSFVHVADVVQRIGRRREYKTRIENRFRGWHDMLLNAVLAFALEQGAERLHLPSSTLALENTDPRRTVGRELFERIYDRDVNRLFGTGRDGDWWVVDVAANRDRVVIPAPSRERIEHGRTICLCHDVEAGLGHVGVDDRLRELADRTWRESLERMLAVERALGVRATYNVVGLLLDDVRGEIKGDGHCLAFHSYDHGEAEQLPRCRRIDYRLKGYRPPRSQLTPELSDEALLFHNFEWLASSAHSLQLAAPVLRLGVVRIPVHFDDFALYRNGLDFSTWAETALARIAENDLVVFSLHDCYAHLWLDRYLSFLTQVRGLGDLRTLDEVAALVTLAASA